MVLNSLSLPISPLAFISLRVCTQLPVVSSPLPVQSWINGWAPSKLPRFCSQSLLHTTTQGRATCRHWGSPQRHSSWGLRLLEETRKGFPVMKWRESNFPCFGAGLVEKKELAFILMLALNRSSFERFPFSCLGCSFACFFCYFLARQCWGRALGWSEGEGAQLLKVWWEKSQPEPWLTLSGVGRTSPKRLRRNVQLNLTCFRCLTLLFFHCRQTVSNMSNKWVYRHICENFLLLALLPPDPSSATSWWPSSAHVTLPATPVPPMEDPRSEPQIFTEVNSYGLLFMDELCMTRS